VKSFAVIAAGAVLSWALVLAAGFLLGRWVG
jgi:hypothetical protein